MGAHGRVIEIGCDRVGSISASDVAIHQLDLPRRVRR